MIEMTLDDKRGNIWDVSELVTGVVWKTTRIGKPGTLEFTLIKGGLYQSRLFSYDNGDRVILRYNKKNIFLGYIFNIDSGSGEAVKITAYDQIRYLLFNETYTFSDVTAAEVIQRIAKDFNLQLGQIDVPSYKIASMIEDGQKLLDIIDKSLALTLIHSGENYVFFDDFGELTLRKVDDLLAKVLVGDDSLMVNYAYKRSIDKDTYNRIKLYKQNKDSGKRDLHVAEDSINIARWGVLQLYQKIDDDMNDAQIKETLNMLSQLKNRETRSISMDAIGDPDIRAGCYVPVVIEELDINQPFLIDACTHRFSGGHTMTLELKVL
jgi:hypothetical protein